MKELPMICSNSWLYSYMIQTLCAQLIHVLAYKDHHIPSYILFGMPKANLRPYWSIHRHFENQQLYIRF